MQDNQEKDNKLTPEQMDNWRKVLVNIFGVYALNMPDEDVQELRDKMQNKIDMKVKEIKE